MRERCYRYMDMDCLPLVYTLKGDRTCNLGLCPDWESTKKDYFLFPFYRWKSWGLKMRRVSQDLELMQWVHTWLTVEFWFFTPPSRKLDRSRVKEGSVLHPESTWESLVTLNSGRSSLCFRYVYLVWIWRMDIMESPLSWLLE